MTTLLLASILVGCRPKDPLEQFWAKTSDLKGYTCKVELQYAGNPKSLAVTITRGFPDRLKIQMQDHQLYVTPTGGYDVVDSLKLYDEYPTPPRFGVTDSRMGLPWQTIFPFFLEGKTAKELYSVTKLTKQKEEKGVLTYSATFKTAMGDVVHEYGIDSAGNLKSFKITGQSARTFTITELKPLDTVDNAAFEYTIPDGYVPMGAAFNGASLYSGEKFPLDKIVAKGSAKAPSLGKPMLIVLANESDPKPAETAAWLEKMKAKVAVVVVKEGEKGDLTIPSFDGLVTGTPMFLLIDKEGLILGTWMGYDAKKIALTEKEILEELDGIK